MARLGLQLDLVERAHFEENRRSASLRNSRRINFNISEEEFIKTYRLDKPSVFRLIDELTPFINLKNETTSVPIDIKVLTALGFFASGSYQRGVGQSLHHAIAQPTVSKCIRLIIDTLNKPEILQKYINFPQTLQERNNLKLRFYEKFKIPGVIGCIDGTHVAIIRPKEFEERFFNRKHYHSLNTQIICDSDLNILSVDASHGGASHDSFIWQHHPVHTHMQQLNANNEAVWLLGDSGYPQRSWLMTPITDATPGTSEAYYTSLHVTARNVVERTIGVMKARWRCLLAHRVMHYDPITAGKIVNACVVLHNIANKARLPIPYLYPEDLNGNNLLQVIMSHTERPNSRNQALQNGRDVRDQLVERLWNEHTLR